MSLAHRSGPFGLIPATLMVAALAVMSLAGCGNDKTTSPNPNPGGGNSTTYTGTTSGATVGGKLSVTLATNSPAPAEPGFRAYATITATGTFAPSGSAAVPLAGTYDNVGKTITVTGAGWTFTGGLTTFGLEGIFNGPSGVYGVFSLQTGTTGVTVVIGTFTSTTGGDNGMFNFSIKGAAIHGNAVTTSSTILPLTGTYSPATGAVSIVHPTNPPPPYLALGTYNSTTGAASGTYDDQAGNAGNWAGTKQP